MERIAASGFEDRYGKKGKNSGIRGIKSASSPACRRCADTLSLVAGLLLLCGCVGGRYEPLTEARDDQVIQLNANTFRVEYRVSPLTSQETLDGYLRRRCAELTVREEYDYFTMVHKHIILAHRRVTAVTVKMFKGLKPPDPAYYDARDVLSLSENSQRGE